MLPLLASATWLGLLAVTPIDTATPAGWLDFVTRGGLLGGAMLIIWALLTDRLISGTRHRKELAARDREIAVWREAALKTDESLARVAGVFFPPSPEQR